MSDSENDPLRGLLSEFALGPAWARGDHAGQERKPKFRDDDARPPRRDDRQGERRPFRRDERGGPGGQRGRFGARDDAPYREEAPPAAGVAVTLVPDAQAVHLIGKEVHQVARVYPLFDVAKILLAERGRCRAIFEVQPDRSPLFRGKLDESLFLTREEALTHLWNGPLRTELLDEETVEVDPPAGNFQAVARCGLSGEWLGPPNFHGYQLQLRRLHRERFAHLPFEVYASKVRTERGEEAVNAWLETTKQKTRWKLKNEDAETWTDDRAEAERRLTSSSFANAFEETRRAEVSAAIPARQLSPSLLTSLKQTGSHVRKHPALLIPAICRALEAEHLPVFKRQGKLHTGPARPHALAADTVLAERPAAMVAWIRSNAPATLAGLWKAVLPEDVTEPGPDYAADLFWLLHQGHILLYTNDTLVVQEPREPTPPKKKKEPKTSPGSAPPTSAAEEESGETEAATSDPIVVAPDVAESAGSPEAGSVTETPQVPEASEATLAASEASQGASLPEPGENFVEETGAVATTEFEVSEAEEAVEECLPEPLSHFVGTASADTDERGEKPVSPEDPSE